MRLSSFNTVSLIPAADGDVQIAIGTSGWIILDVQGAQADVEGHVRHNHGLVRLSYKNACDLRDVLDQIAEPVDHRQTALSALWSPATYTKPVAVPAHARRRRAIA